ncbi:MAG: hypothetical protein ACTSYX_01705 [Candidatus Thorarchaeota archaeon]
MNRAFTSASVVVLVLSVLLVATATVSLSPVAQQQPSRSNTTITTAAVNDPNSRIPVRSFTVVASDPMSYLDEFSYMAAVPTSVFVCNDTQYISPLILSEGSDSETWLLNDWAEYLQPDGGATQLTLIGDVPHSRANNLKTTLGAPIFPWLRPNTPAEAAAMLAVSNWRSSQYAVFALADTEFAEPQHISNEATFTFSNDPMVVEQPIITVSSANPVEFKFTPPAGTGWIQGSLDWTGSVYFTHTLKDPTGRVVDYSVRSQTYQERFSSLVDKPVPLQFWVPNTADGEWTLTLYPEINVASPVQVSGALFYHSGHAEQITVPSDASEMRIDLSWDNAATDLNLALIDPTGRLAAWAPAGSIISSPGNEKVTIPYPMAGTWTAVVAWMNATDEENNVVLSWDITTISPNLSSYLESAANGAALASLLNAPLLYVTPEGIPEVTTWAVDHLGVSVSFLVDPGSLQSSSLVDALGEFSFVNNLNNYHLVSQWIHNLSDSYDVVLTVPKGTGDEWFAPAAFAGAVHGAPVFSLCGDDNFMTTRAEATWVPYLIGPEIDVYITSRYTTRTENGWYDERIPNKYVMEYTAAQFEQFLDDRGMYDENASQAVVVMSDVNTIKPSFDRALQSHFQPGRIPASSAALASIMINRAAHHRFLFRVADSADTALVSMYAYTEGAGFVDNNFNYYTINQYENATTMLSAMGFDIESHIGYNEVFSTIASQVGFWTMSTHGTLTRYPTDPPDRPDGTGLFSLRDEDMPYGVETSTARDANGDNLINPVMFEGESAHHRIESTDTLEAEIEDIGSPIIIITACLLGGSRLPTMMMEHGAVAVMASPRTVYFQPAAMLALFAMNQLTSGNSTGEALSYAISLISADYTDPLSTGDPRDYANQYILYGDPEVHLYEPASTPRVAAIDPLTSEFGHHLPARGIPSMAAVGTTDTLPSVLDALSVDHDFYTPSNFSELVRFLGLRRSVITEPEVLDDLSSVLSTDRDAIASYVRGGGTLVILGANGNLSWSLWPISYDPVPSGTNITIVDSGHPLLTVPNDVPSDISYKGVFESLWENFTVLAVSADDRPVLVAATVGMGKVAFSTILPGESVRTITIENVVAWSSQPSIYLESISLNEHIIWAGDRVIVTIRLADSVGRGIDAASLDISINDTDVSSLVQPSGSGVYVLTLTEDWTNAHPGILSIRIHAQKDGYDTLTVVIHQFMYIRPSPWLAIGVVGAVFVALIAIYVVRKRRRGEPIVSFGKGAGRPSGSSGSGYLSRREREEMRRREEERKKREEVKDLKEFFEV